jgi:long-chain acyl-CoA synthetase
MSLPVVEGLPALSLREIYRGRRLFVLGATGFVGKVLLSMLFDRFPDVGRVYVMVRRGSGTDSESRFWNNVVPSPVFDPLRARHGGAEGLAAFFRDKVRVVDGDITERHLGMSEEHAAAVAADIDVLVNSSGRVTFNPPLESALRTNVEGTRNVIAFVRRMRRPALVHTSTCFVAGNRSGEVWEDERLDGYFPRWRERPATRFSVEQEIADCARIAAEVRAQADDAQVMSRLREQARAKLAEAHRDPDDEQTLRLAVARERKDWIRAELTERGIARAAEWGWPNIYTYTKSMGDQLVARETDLVRSIVRPAIVESALQYPFPGWNEGFTTSAPLVYLALKGQNTLPVSGSLILDMVPVDHVAAGILMVAAQACVEQPKLVHQLSSGDLNPARIERVTTLTGLYKRKRFQSKEAGNRFLNQLVARMEFRPVSYASYQATSLPLVNRVAGRVSSALDRVRPRWGAGRFTEALERLKKGVDEVKRVTDEAHTNIALFRPFILDNEYVFRADNVRALRQRLPLDERALVVWSPETLDWYDYLMNIHFPGLQKWVLPELDQTYAVKPRSVYAYRDLLELFDTATKLHATRVAMRMDRGKRRESYTYANLQELATRVGTFLVGQGVTTGERVILFARNAPEWGMAYFGVLKAGGAVVPIAHESTVAEVVNIARAAGAVGVLVGDDLLDKRPGLVRALRDEGLTTQIWPFEKAFVIESEAVEAERRKLLATRHPPDAVASIIFTSGTTGKPKGVMLSHRNFCFMVSELSRIFELGVGDGLLSVLPLHHSFEFSTGLLMPLSRGAQISYLVELTGEAVTSALRSGHVTAIVGVPALWELLRRRVLQRFGDRSPLLEAAVKGLIAANFELRARVGLDLGMLFFLPVHEGFGGRIRYLISGGSALSADVLKTFHGLGFNFYEGYGLTETAPVLTVSAPKGKPVPGSVGKPLPGVEVAIAGADHSGVGEVIARGRNVMLGYWEDPEGTAQAVRDGWFHTGDLGRFDEEGNLYIVGRSKDVIIDSNGKNVYPDEIEELYRDCPYIKELSVVGLPDGTAEHLGCAVVPDFEGGQGGAGEGGEAGGARLSRAQVQARIEEHFRTVSQRLPFWKRVKTLELWEGELPKTAKRSVKRREVVAELQRRVRRLEPAAGDGREGALRISWFLDAVAAACGKPRSEVHVRSRVDALGFDSLTYTELAAALEGAGVSLPEGVDFTGAQDVAALYELVTGGRPGAAALDRRARRKRDLGDVLGEGDLNIPEPVARAGKAGLSVLQRLFYRKVLETEVRGASRIPRHTHFLVAANHASHLDMGVVKVALGEAGRNIASLAAADYFFSNKLRRAYFANFTNLVPMERTGSIRKSLGVAERVLRRGRSLVVFPEGTRSVTGELADFLPSLGYLALRAEVGILPAYIGGTFASMPKGAALPRTRSLTVAFGPFLSRELLLELTADLPQQEAWRLCAALTQRVVETLRDGVAIRLDVVAVRLAWDGERLGPLASARRLAAVPGDAAGTGGAR